MRPLSADEQRQINEFIKELDYQLGPKGGTNKVEFLNEELQRLKESITSGPEGQNTAGQLYEGGTPFERAKWFKKTYSIGSQPYKDTSWVKWVGITFISIFALACVTLVVMVSFFTPVFDIKSDGKVELFGGAIKLDETNMTVYHNGNPLRVTSQVKGSVNVPEGIQQAEIDFENAQMSLITSESPDEIQWDCQMISFKNSPTSPFSPSQEIEDGTLRIDFDEDNGLRCDISVPKGLALLVIDGENGTLSLENIDTSLDVELENGRVEIHPTPQANYNWDLEVKNGMILGAQAAKDSKTAKKGKVRVENGQIQIVN